MKPEDKRSVYDDAKKNGLRAAQLLTPSWSDADFVAFGAMSAKNRIDPFDLLTVVTSESSTLDPSARNPRNLNDWPIAVGLNQLTRVAASSAGLIPSEKVPGDQSNFPDWKKLADSIVKMTVAQQLPLIDQYYGAARWTNAGKVWGSAAKIYAYNAAAGTDMRDIDDGSLIFGAGSPEYMGNQGLDIDGKGGITGKDLRLAVEFHWSRPLYQAAFLRMAVPSLRAGYLQGWKDGLNRFPLNRSAYGDATPDLFAIGYDDGYATGSQQPVNAVFSLPSYLVAG